METQMQESTGKATELNGVNLEQLQKTISDVRANPKLANFKFRTTNDWVNGGHNRTTVKPFYGLEKDFTERDGKFTLEADTPEVLLGTDKAPDPVELTLHALSACLTTTIVYHAAARGITIRNLNSSYEGDLDLQGFLGLSDKVKKGYKEIRVKFNLETDAKESDLREIIKFSPVYEMISAGVPIKVDVNISKPVLS